MLDQNLMVIFENYICYGCYGNCIVSSIYKETTELSSICFFEFLDVASNLGVLCGSSQCGFSGSTEVLFSMAAT